MRMKNMVYSFSTKDPTKKVKGGKLGRVKDSFGLPTNDKQPLIYSSLFKLATVSNAHCVVYF